MQNESAFNNFQFCNLSSDFCIRYAHTIDPIFSPSTTRRMLPV
jgi:hypothetical protein